ncbi:hybrid sensor histidine kinase/response regulator [Massilia terrae]|uniref:histidine kinase n=1 Tax=Massilia terrae TaxID=1811224 RepID=A0ABT2CZP7_9BURK|nr:ATP-binding protein [Massilia terrae]MCS0659446.1 ATP-binding protein [Massilia terrae]
MQNGIPTQAVSSGLSREQRRTLGWLRTGVILGTALPLLLFALTASLHYSEVWEEATTATQRTSRILSEHALKLFDTSEVLLQQLDHLVAGSSDADIAARQELQAQTARLVAGLPQVNSVGVVDARGHPLLTSLGFPAPGRVDLSDRDFFVALRDGYPGVYVSGALIGKHSGEPFFSLAHARRKPDGSFGGIVQVSLDPQYLDAFYREVATSEDDMAVTMLSEEGSLIARFPHAAAGAKLAPSRPVREALAKDSGSATLVLTSQVDKQLRLITFRKVGGYPVQVAASVRVPAILAGWARDLLWSAVLTVCASAGLGMFGWFALRKTRRELELANCLYEESQQRKQIEHALLHAQKLEALGHLTGGVAHDFNNLLMVIGMNAQLIGRTVDGMREHPRLEAITRSVSNGAKLTRQMLSFSRRQPLLPATLDLARELDAMVELCAPVLGKTVEITVDVAEGTPPLLIDRAELELSLINLAINARHAMPDGGAFVVRARPLPDRQLEIVVRDNGCGIPPDILPHVTEPFFSTRPQGEGTGLGLSQVNTMCQRAGGVLRIDSRLGAGTTVHLRFPAAAGVAGVVVDEPQAERSFPLRMLLVEDNNEIAAAAQLVLESLGCSVRRCATAEEAAALLEHADPLPQAVLSDITMPGSMDGIALARHLRARYPHLPVALMTGYAERLHDAEALHLRVLPKPFDEHTLKEVLAWLWAHREERVDA